MTVDQKRKQLQAKGWSDKRIEQYLKDWTWKIPKNFGPKAFGEGSREHKR